MATCKASFNLWLKYIHPKRKKGSQEYTQMPAVNMYI